MCPSYHCEPVQPENTSHPLLITLVILLSIALATVAGTVVILYIRRRCVYRELPGLNALGHGPIHMNELALGVQDEAEVQQPQQLQNIPL